MSDVDIRASIDRSRLTWKTVVGYTMVRFVVMYEMVLLRSLPLSLAYSLALLPKGKIRISTNEIY